MYSSFSWRLRVTLMLGGIALLFGGGGMRPVAAQSSEARYEISTEVQPPYTGRVDVLPRKPHYALGDTVRVRAIAQGRFSFGHWAGDVQRLEAETTLVVRENLHLVAEMVEGPLAERPLLSPRRNVYYEAAPRDLHFVVHAPDFRGIVREGKPVPFEERPLPIRETLARPVPGARLLRIDAATVAEWGGGQHRLAFRFAEADTLHAEITVVPAGEEEAGELQIVSFNVEHGTSVLLNLPNGEILLLDAGTRENAERYLVPFLRQHLPVDESGRQRIDHVYITHWHYDHFQGLTALLEHFEIGQVRYNLEVPVGADARYAHLATPNDPYDFGRHGFAPTHWDAFHVGNALDGPGGDAVEWLVLNAAVADPTDPRFAYFSPEHYETYYNRNNRSLSLRLTYRGFVFVFGGDAYQHAQRAMRHAFGDAGIRADVYHANHHFHGGVDPNYLLATDPVLILTSANEVVYDREAFSRVVMHDVVPVLERSRLVENLLSHEVGHTVMRVGGGRDGAQPGLTFRFETYLHTAYHDTVPAVPLLLGRPPQSRR